MAACSEPRPQNAAIREAAGEEGAVPPLPQAQSPKKAQPFPGPLWGASVGVLLWGPHRLPNPSQDSVAVLCVWAPRSREQQLAPHFRVPAGTRSWQGGSKRSESWHLIIA